MNRQSWTYEEDEAISKLVAQHGFNDWTQIAHKLKETYNITKRTGKQCRERWYNHLNPAVNKKPWANDEEEQLFQLHKSHGNRWKDISRNFAGRTDNDIKNHFYSTLRRSLRRLNKILGQKNSTSQMREIKPSVLSTIMNYLYDQEHGIKNELYRSLKDLPSLIFEFANFKPIKTNLKFAKVEDAKIKISEIFELITRFNEEYELSKAMRHQNKALKRMNSRKETGETLPTVHSITASPSLAFSVKIQEAVKEERDPAQAKQTSASQPSSSQAFQANDILNPERAELLQQKEEVEEAEGDSEMLPPYRSRNMSLEDDEIDIEDMQDMQDPEQPSVISRAGEGLDLMVVGHHWQPPSWERQAEMKEFVDEVLEINYEQTKHEA